MLLDLERAFVGGRQLLERVDSGQRKLFYFILSFFGVLIGKLRLLCKLDFGKKQ